MVSNRRRLDGVFAALGDPTRRALVERLGRGSASVGELARPFRMSRPAVSKHLRVLERAGLVRRLREGRTTRCRLEPARLRDAAQWLDRYGRFWRRQLDQLGRFLAEPHEEGPA